jgi:uncharacterized RDD family membrane protein YckC
MAAVDWDHFQIACFPKTPQPSRPARRPAGKAKLASRSDRLAARLIDLALSVAVGAPGFYVLQISNDAGQRALARGLLVLGVPGLAVVQGGLLTLKGQTIGKKAVGVRIVRFSDGAHPGFLRAVALRSVLPGLIVYTTCLGKLLGLIDILNLLGEERRCLHDYLTGTKVVDA